jgi:hypothetical protein
MGSGMLQRDDTVVNGELFGDVEERDATLTCPSALLDGGHSIHPGGLRLMFTDAIWH